MVRFDDYKPRSEKPNGYGGGKTVYVDEVRWIPVPDVATRVAQVETGELDLADDLNADAYDRLKKNAERAPDHLEAVLLARRGPQQEGGPDDEPEAAPGLAGGDRHRAHHEEGGRRPGRVLPDGLDLIHQEMGAWHTKMQGCPGTSTTRRRRRSSCRRPGYKGEPIRFMATQEYKWMYDFALVSKQQLEDAGFNIDLQVVDWATLVKRRNNSKEYDAFTTGIGRHLRPGPLELPHRELAGLDLPTRTS